MDSLTSPEVSALDGKPAQGALALPNVIVIGAQKCGTSAVHAYLGLHPEISMSRPKELNFFVDHPVGEGPFWSLDPEKLERMTLKRRNCSKGLGWYARHFDPTAPVRGESSPSYTAPWFPEVPAKIASALPHVKLIFMVRDPLERAMSEYLDRRAKGRERREANDALADPRGTYIARSRYGALLERYLHHFPAERILVLSQEDLLTHRTQTMREVYRYIGVDPSFRSPRFQRERNRSKTRGAQLIRRLEKSPLATIGYRLPDEVKWGIERLVTRRRQASEENPLLEPGLRERLVEALSDDTARLRELTGDEFPEWSL